MVTLFALLMVGNTPMEHSAKVENIRANLADYYSRIAAVRLEYEDFILKKVPGMYSDTNKQLVIESLPRRVLIREVQKLKEGGTVETRKYSRYTDAAKFTEINDFDGIATVKSNHVATMGNEHYPLCAIGYQYPETSNVRLDSLFTEPQNVQFLGEEVLDGLSTIVVRVTPIPISVQPNASAERRASEIVTCWLVPEYGYIPKRMRICTSRKLVLPEKLKHLEVLNQPDLVHCGEGLYTVRIYENLDFRPVRDGLRDRVVYLPHLISAGPREYRVSRFEINPRLPDEVFRPNIPSDFTVLQDGVFTRRGTASRRNVELPPAAAPVAVADVTPAAALNAASQAVAPEQSDWKSGLWILCALVGATGFVMLLWRKQP